MTFWEEGFWEEGFWEEGFWEEGEGEVPEDASPHSRTAPRALLAGWRRFPIGRLLLLASALLLG